MYDKKSTNKFVWYDYNSTFVQAKSINLINNFRSMNNLVKTTIELSDLQIGMTVEHNGSLHTISNSNINPSYWTYGQVGRPKTTITRVQFAVPTANGMVLR